MLSSLTLVLGKSNIFRIVEANKTDSHLYFLLILNAASTAPARRQGLFVHHPEKVKQ
jgi:hypothetical protein